MRILKGLGVGIAAAILLSVILLVVLAAVMMKFDITEKTLRTAALAVLVIGIAIAAFLAARITGRMGWLTGAATGLMFSITVGMIGLCMGSGVISPGVWISALVSIGTGAASGMVGVAFGQRK